MCVVVSVNITIVCFIEMVIRQLNPSEDYADIDIEAALKENLPKIKEAAVTSKTSISESDK